MVNPNRTLIIPDFHEQVEKIPFLERVIDEAERIVSLGDWPDTFGQHQPRAVFEFMLRYADDPRWTWLIGNHDAHYMFKHPWFRCSGYEPTTQVVWDEMMPPEFLAKWKVWTEVHGFTVSHAGFHPDTLDLKTPEKHEEALQMARDGGFHKMWMPGEDVGGPRGEVGGPNWLRWHRMEPCIAQIVGHTPSKVPRVKKHALGDCYNIDTHLRFVAWVDDEGITTEAVEVL